MNFIHDVGNSVVMKPHSATQSIALQDETFGRVVTTVGRFHAEYQLSPQQKSLLNTLQAFYTDERIEELLRPIVTQSGATSLRALDWLCTNWSKSRNIMCKTANGHMFNIHQGYKMALSYYRRRNFDPFRRRLRLVVTHPRGDILSTVGQLNYLKWIHENGILVYAAEHASLIEENMNLVTGESRKRKATAHSSGEMVKRNELTAAPATKVTVYRERTCLTLT